MIFKRKRYFYVLFSGITEKVVYRSNLNIISDDGMYPARVRLQQIAIDFLKEHNVEIETKSILIENIIELSKSEYYEFMRTK